MRDITPKKPTAPRLGGRRRALFGGIGVTLAVFGGGYIFLQQDTAPQLTQQSQSADEVQATNIDVEAGEVIQSTKLRTFGGADFVELYNSFAYPNVAEFETSPSITNSLEADARIRSLAIERGYRARSVAAPPLVVVTGGQLQERAATAWEELVESARKDGHRLTLTAGFRTIEDQQALFLTALRARGATDASIAAGNSDAAVVAVLKGTSIPGYTRHHSGYTVDIGCASDPGLPFGSTECYQWLSRNNYEKAKLEGWIPSYPAGAPNQGPDPEPWEYSWVGTDAVRE